MTAYAAVTRPPRRGACPGLSAPMPTGDGLLVRLMPVGTIALMTFTELCRAARLHGNGVIEVTARGSIQVRGLSSSSAPRFAADVAALGIAAADGIPVLSNALAGLDPEEVLDAGALAADLRLALARRSLAARLCAKVSIAVDGGSAVNLEGLSADVYLRAEAMDGRPVLRVSIGGDGASAVELGVVAAAHGTEAAVRLLEVVSRHGRHVRARDILIAETPSLFRSAIDDLVLSNSPPRPAYGSRDAIGAHRLRDGSLACGIGVAFGHSDATAFERLTETASDAGATGLRAAANRTLMFIELTQDAANLFFEASDRLGFIVRADDPRRHVVACAGAPVCASAHIASRAIGPLVAASAATLIDGSFKIHVSGCAKGCAHAASAELTIVGTPDGCALIADGSARDAPFAVMPANDVPSAIAGALAHRAHAVKHRGGHG